MHASKKFWLFSVPIRKKWQEMGKGVSMEVFVVMLTNGLFVSRRRINMFPIALD